MFVPGTTDLAHWLRPRRVGGTWFRGDARIIAIEGTTCVHFYRPFVFYSMQNRARAAMKALLDIGRTPDEGRVLDFAHTFGPLVDFLRWARREPQPSAVERVFEDSLIFADRLPEQEITERRQLIRPGSDHAPFREWCERHGRLQEWHYVARVITHQVFPEPLGEPLLPEPLGLYYWAGQMALKVHEELERNEQQRDTLDWLAARLQDARLALAEPVGSVATEGDNLLAYLAVRLVLDARGEVPRRRKCRGCNREFDVRDARQIYCSLRCGDTSRKHNNRRRPRL